MVAGDAYALAGHMCMGHIYLRGNTTDGTSLLAPLTYVDVEDEGLTCDQAVEAYTGGVLPPMGSMDGMDGMSGMPGMSGMGDAPAPAASGAAANTVLGGTVVAALASVALAVL